MTVVISNLNDRYSPADDCCISDVKKDRVHLMFNRAVLVQILTSFPFLTQELVEMVKAKKAAQEQVAAKSKK